MPLLGKHLIPSVHISMVPSLGTSVTGLCQISRLCGIDVSDECSNYHIPHILASFHLLCALTTDQIYGRFVKLCEVMEHSGNEGVNYLTHICMSSARSSIGSNLGIVGKRHYVDDKRKLLDEGSLLLRQSYINEYTEEDYMAWSLIQELRGYISGIQKI